MSLSDTLPIGDGPGQDLWRPEPQAQPDTPAPTGLESVDETLHGAFAAVYGRGADAAQRAVFDARAQEGPTAYDRFAETPEAYGRVVDRGAVAPLAAALPVRDQTADYLGIRLPEVEATRRENGPELDLDPGIYVSGPRADDFVAMLSARTGLTLRQNERGGLVAGEPVEGGMEGTSPTLRALVVRLSSGEAGLRPVEINAVGSADRVFFDAESRVPDVRRSDRGKVDMGDFDQAAVYPEFQAAQLGHILTERMTSGSYEQGHTPALDVERLILEEMTGLSLQNRPAKIDPESIEATLNHYGLKAHRFGTGWKPGLRLKPTRSYALEARHSRMKFSVPFGPALWR